MDGRHFYGFVTMVTIGYLIGLWGFIDEVSIRRPRERDQRTGFLIACMKNLVYTMEWLVLHGITYEDMIRPDNDGWTPFLWACSMGHNWLLDWLFECGLIDEVSIRQSREQDHRSGFLMACMNSHMHTMEWLELHGLTHVDMIQKDRNGQSPFSCSPQVVNWLIAHQVPPDENTNPYKRPRIQSLK